MNYTISEPIPTFGISSEWQGTHFSDQNNTLIGTASLSLNKLNIETKLLKYEYNPTVPYLKNELTDTRRIENSIPVHLFET